MNLTFFINSILLGFSLAMDAFSVSIANGIADPSMQRRMKVRMAGVFGLFQWAMPMAGWILVHYLAEKFQMFQKVIPYIALLLLGYIGGKMVYEGVAKKESGDEARGLGMGTLLLQGIATSIDALSVGFTISDYQAVKAFVCALIIGVLTFFICLAGVRLGRRFGMKLANKATVVGGLILIGIGLEIFIRSFMG